MSPPDDVAVRVIVADDQAIVRDGLVTVLSLAPGIEVVGEAADGEAAVARAISLRPDVVLMDLRMPRVDGARATERLARDAPGVAVLILTTYADDASIADALRAGARGYVTKDAGREQLVAAVRAVARGQSTFAADVGRRLAEVWVQRGAAPAAGEDAASDLMRRFETLTRREAEVLALVVEGLGNAEIAERLFIGVSTVKSHINALFAKLGATTRAQAIARARR